MAPPYSGTKYFITLSPSLINSNSEISMLKYIKEHQTISQKSACINTIIRGTLNSPSKYVSPPIS